MAITALTDSDYSALFKRAYGDYGDQLYGSGVEDVLESQIPKTFDFVGNERHFPLKVGFGGGVGFGSLPAANRSKNVDVYYTTKQAYARLNLDRKTIVQSRGKMGAFIEATKEETEGKLKSFRRAQAMTLFNDGTGILFQFSGSTSGTASAPVITVLTTGTYRYRSGFLEEGDYVNVNSDASVFEITAVTSTTVTLSRLSGSLDLTGIGAGTHSVYLQNSKDVAPQGILSAVGFTTGTLYNVAYQRRFAPYINTKSAATLLTTDDLNAAVLQMKNSSGECPNLIIPSVTQMNLLLNQLEDKKRYCTLDSSSNKLSKKATVSFQGIEFMSVDGPIPIVSSRYVRNDQVLLVNTKKMFRDHAEAFGWFDNDGTVLLRMANDDAYEARYGGYYENFINPLYQGVISNNAVS